MSERMGDTSHPLRLILATPDFSNMGNVPSTHIFIENLCGAGYEMGFPKGADMKPPRKRLSFFGGLFTTGHLN